PHAIYTLFPYTTLFRSDGRAGTGGIERGLLRRQHEVVNRLLPRGELPVHREGARHVGGVLSPLGARVHHDQVAVPDLPPTDVVRSEEHTSELQSRSDLV